MILYRFFKGAFYYMERRLSVLSPDIVHSSHHGINDKIEEP